MNKRLLILFWIGFALSNAVYGQGYEHTFVFLNSKPDKEALSEAVVDALMTGHLANIDSLVSQGKLLVAGPFDGGGGIFILSTGSLTEARAWLSTDPAIQADRWDVEMYPFAVSEGKICTPSEPYEMVTYNFVRFIAHNEIANYKMSGASETEPSAIEVIQQLKAAGDLLIECDFANDDGGIFIYKGDNRSQLIDKDPSVQNGEVDVAYKSIWLTLGSFCEP